MITKHAYVWCRENYLIKYVKNAWGASNPVDNKISFCLARPSSSSMLVELFTVAGTGPPGNRAFPFPGSCLRVLHFHLLMRFLENNSADYSQYWWFALNYKIVAYDFDRARWPGQTNFKQCIYSSRTVKNFGIFMTFEHLVFQ